MYLRFFLLIPICMAALTNSVQVTEVNSTSLHRCNCKINITKEAGLHGSVCQITINQIQTDEELLEENERLNNTINLLEKELRRLLGLLGNAGNSKWNRYLTKYVDGVKWTPFWWYKEGSGWPSGETDVLADEYGSCEPDAKYCFSRLPEELSERGAEMLGIDSAGTIYRWAFNAYNPTAHAAWMAFHDHKQTKAGAITNKTPWNPKVVAGIQPNRPQDSFMYRTQNGVASIMIDDDNCDCLTSLSIGHGMCGSTFKTVYGPANRYGVDLLYDSQCQTPSPDNGLTLYFRDNDD